MRVTNNLQDIVKNYVKEINQKNNVKLNIRHMDIVLSYYLDMSVHSINSVQF